MSEKGSRKSKDLEYVQTENGDYKVKRNKTLDNIMLIVSLLAALVLWVYVYNSENTTAEKTFNLVSIEKKNADALFAEHDLVVQYMNIDTINVSLMGSKDAINNIDISDIKAYINLSGISEAKEYTLDVMVDVPEGITCVSQTVYTVDVQVDRSASKEFSITADNVILNGWTLESGYSFAEISTNVSSVILEGASNDIAKVYSIGVVTGAMGNVKNHATVNCSLVLLDAFGNPLDLPGLHVRADKDDIEAIVKVQKTKSVALELLTTYGYVPAEYISITPSRVEITGDPNTVDAIDVITLGTENEKELGADLIFRNTYDITVEGVTVTDESGKEVTSADVVVDLSALPHKTVKVSLYKGDEIVDDSVDINIVVKHNDETSRLMLSQITASDVKAILLDGSTIIIVEISERYKDDLFACGIPVPEKYK